MIPRRGMGTWGESVSTDREGHDGEAEGKSKSQAPRMMGILLLLWLPIHCCQEPAQVMRHVTDDLQMSRIPVDCMRRRAVAIGA